MAKDTKMEADLLRKLAKDSTNANNKLAKQMGELKDVLAAGFTKVSNALDALGLGLWSLGPLIAHASASDTIAQLTAINSHYVQHGQSFLDVAIELSKISGTMVQSASTSSKMSPATNPHVRPLNLNLVTTAGVKGWLAGVTLPDCQMRYKSRAANEWFRVGHGAMTSGRIVEGRRVDANVE